MGAGKTTGRVCGARKKSGGTCGRPAGAGTEHLGHGCCSNHGGRSPNHNKANAPAMALAMGAPIDISPHEALIWCVRTAAGELAYCNAMLARLQESDVVGNPLSTHERPLKYEKGAEDSELTVIEQRRAAPEMNIWVRARQEALDRVARYSKMALDAGVAERQVQLAERYGAMIADVIGHILSGLDLSAAQKRKAPALVKGGLALLEGGAAAA